MKSLIIAATAAFFLTILSVHADVSDQRMIEGVVDNLSPSSVTIITREGKIRLPKSAIPQKTPLVPGKWIALQFPATDYAKLPITRADSPLDR